MRLQVTRWTLASVLFTPLVATVPQASAEPITRSSWVPNVGELFILGEQPLGDL
jgi:hypothetical protein